MFLQNEETDFYSTSLTIGPTLFKWLFSAMSSTRNNTRLVELDRNLRHLCMYIFSTVLKYWKGPILRFLRVVLEADRFDVIWLLWFTNIQGSHWDWKTWKNGKAFSSQGKVREFWTDWKSQGKPHKILENWGNFRKKLLVIFQWYLNELRIVC